MELTAPPQASEELAHLRAENARLSREVEALAARPVPLGDVAAIPAARTLEARVQASVRALSRSVRQIERAHQAFTRSQTEAKAANVRLGEAATSLAELAARTELLQATLDRVDQGIAVFDRNLRLAAWNRPFFELLKLPPGLSHAGTPYSAFRPYGHDVFGPAPPMLPDLYERRGADGTVLEVRLSPMPAGGFVASYADVTARKEDESRIRYLASHDPLTGLANRALFHDRLELALANARRFGHGLATLCLDLDDFKDVNDALGHQTGDRLLQAITERAQRVVRDADTFARIGGDEFALIFTRLASPDAAAAAAQRLLDAFLAPFSIDDRHIHITASIGITLFPSDGDSPEELLRNADMAMYRAKAERRNAYRFFHRRMDSAVQARKSLEEDMRGGIERGEFSLVYQPKIDVRGGKLCGMEALLRWNHPQRGAVGPAEFIPVAEQSGLIVQLGERILDEACRQMQLWHDQLPPGLRVSVNLSAVQFKRGDPLRQIREALDRHGLPAQRLEIEITESTIMEDVDSATKVLGALRQHGVAIAIDDFGTGYSSLGYLSRFPAQVVKIDRSFVRNLDGDANNQAIVTAILSLAGSLGLHVVAEGVETAAEMEFLSRRGCHAVQGFYFSPGLPANDFLPFALANL